MFEGEADDVEQHRYIIMDCNFAEYKIDKQQDCAAF